MYLYFGIVLPLKYPSEPAPTPFWNLVYLLDVIIAIYLSVCITFHYVMAVIVPPGDVTTADAERWAAVEEDLLESGVNLDGAPDVSVGVPPPHPADRSAAANKGKPWRQAAPAEAEPDRSLNFESVLQNADALDELMPDSTNPRQRVTDAFSSSRSGWLAKLDFKRFWSPSYSPAECPSYLRIGTFNKPLSTPLDDVMRLNLTVGDVSVRCLRGMKFCKKCQLPKPSRAHHCSVCNKCVLKMDHHVGLPDEAATEKQSN
jgi:hypothetical protein